MKKHRIIQQNYTDIRNWIKRIAVGDSTIEIPELPAILVDRHLQESLLTQSIPENLVEKLRSENGESRKLAELIRLLLFTQYLNKRVAVTLVTAKSEEYAFDMFEALNTTGTPLTAFETFKPRVTRAEKLALYEKSPSKKYIQPIEDYLEQYTKAEDKQKATDRLLIPFALAESGRKLSKRLREQRGYLKQRYEELNNLDEKRDFVRHMAHTAIFLRDIWPENKTEPPKLSDIPFTNQDVTLLCVNLLRASNHEITIGPLARYFSHVRSAKDNERDYAVQELETAIKAITAFWVFWRGIRRSTGTIDSRYRDLMEKGNSVLQIEPFSRRKIIKSGDTLYEYCPRPTSDDLKKTLRYYLANWDPKVQSKNDWVRYAKEIPFYLVVPNPITRFILLASTHDTYYDKASPGLPQAARHGTLNMLSVDQWENNFTIEHIAPKDRSADGWESNLYIDPDLVHQIGNLTLLPPVENSVIGNKSWVLKRLIYRVLAAPNQDELDIQMKIAEEMGLEIKENTQVLLRNARYLPHVRAISMLEDTWDSNFVRARSERVLELAWSRLASWLDLPQ